MITKAGDAWIIKTFFEPLAAYIHARWGIGNYTAAKWVLFAGLTLIGVSLGILFGVPWWTEIGIQPRYGWNMLAFNALYGIVFLGEAIGLEKKYREPVPGLAAPDMSYARNARTMFLWISMAGIVIIPFLIPEVKEKSTSIEKFLNYWGDLSWFISSIPVTVGAYLSACTPKFPSDSSAKVPIGALQTVK